MCSRFCTPIALAVCAAAMAAAPQQPATPDSQGSAEWRRLIDESDQFYQQGRFDQARLAAEKALRYAEHFPPLDVRLPSTLHSLGFLYQEEARYPEAAAFYLRAIHLWEQIGPEQNRSLIFSTTNLVGTYFQSHNYRGAKKLLDEHLPEMERTASTPAERAAIVNIRGSIAVIAGRYADAELYYRKSLAYWEENRPADGQKAAVVWINLSHLYTITKRLPQALDAAMQAVGDMRDCEPTVRPTQVQALDMAGDLCVKLKRPADAVALFERAITIAKEAFGPAHEITCEVMMHEAEVLHALRQDAEAESLRAQVQSMLRSPRQLTVDVHALMPPGR
ncbi:MAG TPA: tetratricopeptide repeat protein [Verrucomicrobiae bacterium]|nr:tetratricopeptide repeat protein [Verrucomicrobiae bacterium]